MNADEMDNEIGEAAGVVWKYLDQAGSASPSKLAKEIALSRDLVMQGIGWLARENKIEFIEGKRGKQIALK